MRNTKKLFKYIALVLALVAVLSVIAGCSRLDDARSDPAGNIQQTPTDPPSTDTINVVRPTAARNAMNAALRNRTNKYAPKNNLPEWFVIDLQMDFRIDRYGTPLVQTPTSSSSIRVILQANVHILNNNFSELKLEIYNRIPTTTQTFALYYLEKSAYIELGAPQDRQNFYIEEINLSEALGMVGFMLADMGIDPAQIFAAMMISTQATLVPTGIAFLDEGLMAIVATQMFDAGPNSARERIRNSGGTETRDYGLRLTLAGLLNMVDGMDLLGIKIDLKNIWGIMGLPNLDPLLNEFIGTDIGEILSFLRNSEDAYMWMLTSMEDDVPRTEWNASAGQHQIVYDGAGQAVTHKAPVYTGIAINLPGRKSPTYPKGQFDIDIYAPSVRASMADRKTQIWFPDRLTESAKGTSYQKAGLGNLEIEGEFSIQSDPNGVIRLNSVLGTMIDLGGIGEIPLYFPKEGAVYTFTMNLKLALDFFNPSGTRAEAIIYFNDTDNPQNKQPFLALSIVNNRLMIDCSKLIDFATYKQQAPNFGQGQVPPIPPWQILPNISMEFSINSLLDGLLGGLSNILDPNFIRLPIAPQNSAPQNNAEEESGGLDIMLLISILAGHYQVYPQSGTENLVRVFVDNKGINDILRMLGMDVGSGGVGFSEIEFSMFSNDPLNTIVLRAGVTEEVDVVLRLTKFGWFKRPVFENAYISDLAFVNLDDERIQFINLEASGYFQFGINETSSGIVLDLDDIVGDILSNVMFSLGVTESADFTIRYDLKAGINFRNALESGLSITFYISDLPFLTIYFEASSDTLFLDFSNLSNLKTEITALASIGTIDNIKITGVGISSILSSLPLIGDGGSNAPKNAPIHLSSTPQGVAVDALLNLILGANPLYFALANADAENEPDGGFDLMSLLMDVLGQGITVEINDEIKSLIIRADEDLLTILVAMLGATANMPKIAFAMKLQLIGVGDLDDNGYISVHFKLFDDGAETAMLFADIVLIQTVRIPISRTAPVYFPGSFTPGEFKELDDYLASLVLAFHIEGNISVLAPDNDIYESELVNGMLAGILPMLAVRFGIDGFSINLQYELKMIAHISDVLAIFNAISGSGEVPEHLNTELSITLSDLDYGGRVFGLYIIDNNVYLELDYFGVENVSLKGAGLFLNELFKMFASDESEPINKDDPENRAMYPIPSNGARFGTGADALQGIVVLLSPDRVALHIGKSAISAVLALMFEDGLPLEIHGINLAVDVSRGIALSISVGIEVFEISLSLSDLFVLFEKDKHIAGSNYPVIMLPNDRFPVPSGDGGMPEYVYIKFEGEMFIRADQTEYGDDRIIINTNINLTPAVKAIFGEDIDLIAYLEMLGVVEGRIAIVIEASLNLTHFVRSAARIELYSGDTTQNNRILSAQYRGLERIDPETGEPRVYGDLFIDTDAFELGKLWVQDVGALINVFLGLEDRDFEWGDIVGGNPSAPRYSPLSSDEVMAKNYLDIMFIRGGISFALTKGLLTGLMLSLGGFDLTEFFENVGGRDEVVYGEILISPITLALGVHLGGIEAGLNLGRPELVFERLVPMPSDIDEYTLLLSLERLSITLSGAIDFAIISDPNGTYFDHIVFEIKEMLALSGTFDQALLDSLLNFGIILQIIADSFGDTRFGGVLNYEIEVHVNLLDIIDDLYLALRLFVLDGDFRTDILGLYIMPDPREGAGLTLLLDAEFLGIEKIRVNDVFGFISAFTGEDGLENEPNGTAPKNSGLPQLPRNASAPEILSANVLIRIASDPAQIALNKNAPILISITESAFSALLEFMDMGSILNLLGVHKPWAEVSLASGDSLLSLGLGLKICFRLR
ncbi:MAG: hypothetical protein FWD49_00550 [Firmicutes bacterium]|nr:hypothetical protein [Bacillota bacterium]